MKYDFYIIPLIIGLQACRQNVDTIVFIDAESAVLSTADSGSLGSGTSKGVDGAVGDEISGSPGTNNGTAMGSDASVSSDSGTAGNAGSTSSTITSSMGSSEPAAYGYGGPSKCNSMNVAFCENFENGLDKSIWSLTQAGDAALMTDSVHAARGTSALHVRTPSGNGYTYITQKINFPVAQNTLYVRMFVFFGDPITTAGHFTLVQANGPDNNAAVRFGGQYMAFGVGSDGGGSGDWTDKDTQLVPSGVWICTESEFQGSTNEFHVWLNNLARPALDTGINNHANFIMPQFNQLWFGWWMYNATEPQELWIDEIVVDDKPIGCAN